MSYCHTEIGGPGEPLGTSEEGRELETAAARQPFALVQERVPARAISGGFGSEGSGRMGSWAVPERTDQSEERRPLPVRSELAGLHEIIGRESRLSYI